jgi:hypothetical protein
VTIETDPSDATVTRMTAATTSNAIVIAKNTTGVETSAMTTDAMIGEMIDGTSDVASGVTIDVMTDATAVVMTGGTSDATSDVMIAATVVVMIVHERGNGTAPPSRKMSVEQRHYVGWMSFVASETTRTRETGTTTP